MLARSPAVIAVVEATQAPTKCRTSTTRRSDHDELCGCPPPEVHLASPGDDNSLKVLCKALAEEDAQKAHETHPLAGKHRDVDKTVGSEAVV